MKERSPIPIYVDEDCHTLARRRRLRRTRARDQRQAREVGRHPRGGAHGARRARARSRLHARLHDRVGPRHRRGRAHREPLRPRRPRRQHPARAKTRGRVCSSSTACRCPRSCRGSASRPHEALPDPRRGLQRRPALRQDDARRAALSPRRRRRDPRLDARAGDTEHGVPVVQTRRRGARARAEHGARRRRDAGRTLPAGVDRAAQQCVAAGLDIENGLHVFLADDPELARLAARARRRAARPAPAARRPLDRDGREPRACRRRSC